MSTILFCYCYFSYFSFCSCLLTDNETKVTEQLFRARPMPPVGHQAACFLFHGVPGGLLLGWHCLPRRPAGSVACRGSCTSSLALLPSLSSSRPCGPQAGVWLVGRWRWLHGLAVCVLFNCVYCSIGHGTEASVTNNALLGLALWVFSTFRHGLPQWMEKVRCARNLNIRNFRCAEVRNFGYYRTCISRCLQVTFLFLVVRFW